MKCRCANVLRPRRLPGRQSLRGFAANRVSNQLSAVAALRIAQQDQVTWGGGWLNCTFKHDHRLRR